MEDIIPLQLFKAKAKDYLVNNWKSEICKNAKLTLNHTIKSSYETEEYLNVTFNENLRSFLSKIRYGSLKLQIEVGRYYSIPRSERLCKICNSKNDVEDEIHFLLYCHTYQVPRHLLHKLARIEINEFDNLSDPGKCNLFTKMYKQLAMYISDAWKLRNNILQGSS